MKHNNFSKLFCISMAIVLFVILTGCTHNTPNQVSEVATPTEPPAPTETAASTETTIPTETTTPTLTPTPTPHTELSNEPDDSPYAGWHRYTNFDYGFSFTFPADWEAKRDHEHYIYVSPQSNPDYRLIIGFRSIEERMFIQRSGAPAGEYIQAGKVSFFGQDIEKYHIVYEEKNKAVLYNYACETDVEYLIFSLSLDYSPNSGNYDYEAFEIPVKVENIADEIMESFAFVESPLQVAETAIAHSISATETQTALSLKTRSTLEPVNSPFAGWYRYTDPYYGFSFAFPPDWDEIQYLPMLWEEDKIQQHRLEIGPEEYPKIQLVIGFKSKEESSPIEHTDLPMGEIVFAGEIPFFGQNIRKQNLVYEERTTMVFYNRGREIPVDDMVFTFYIDWVSTEIPIAVVETVDRILLSFELGE